MSAIRMEMGKINEFEKKIHLRFARKKNYWIIVHFQLNALFIVIPKIVTLSWAFPSKYFLSDSDWGEIPHKNIHSSAHEISNVQTIAWLILNADWKNHLRAIKYHNNSHKAANTTASNT